jgi:Protein of unknown function (DUF2891)
MYPVALKVIVMQEPIDQSKWIQIALANVQRPYPQLAQHLSIQSGDFSEPQLRHPAFYGSYDWHSCVHMHWSLLRLLRLQVPALNPEQIQSQYPEVFAVFDSHFTKSNCRQELLYLSREGALTWERPYGWGWLLKLASELQACVSSGFKSAQVWLDALNFLALPLAEWFVNYLSTAQGPVRHGVHSNTAFAMLLALDYAKGTQHHELERVIQTKSIDWFANDKNYPLTYDVSSEDFLSPCLTQAHLMSRCLPQKQTALWLKNFLPSLFASTQTRNEVAQILKPLEVTQESDARQVHWHGLNLSRAWCLRSLVRYSNDPTIQQFLQSLADAHEQASWSHITKGDYVSTHWLISFALLAKTEIELIQ